MIECENCGANLSLSDEKCPYCGSVNPDALEHVRQLQAYKEKYEKTRDEIQEKVHGHNTRRLKLTVIFVLFVLMVLSLLFAAMSEEIRWDIDRETMYFQLGKKDTIVEELLETRNYERLSLLKYPSTGSKEGLLSAVRWHDRVEEDILKIYHKSYYGNDISLQVNNIAGDYSLWRSRRDNLEKYHPEYMEYADEIQKNIDEMLMYYLDFSEEEVEILKDSLEAERVSIFWEKLKENE